MTNGSTLTQLTAGNPYQRLRAGRLVSQLLEPQLGLVDRKSETIRFPTPQIIERSITVELMPSAITEIESQIQIDLVPFLLLPKALYHGLELRDRDDRQVPLVPRRTNARLAVSHLISHAYDGAREIGLPSEELLRHLGGCVGRFPLDYESPPSFAERASERQAGLAGRDREWWAGASRVPGWPKLLANYEESFLVMARERVQSTDLSSVYSIHTSEPRDVPGPARVREVTEQRSGNAVALSIRINELGRARAEYVRIEAPDGMFLGDASLERLGVTEDDFHYRWRASPDQSTMYLRQEINPAPRAATLAATLWPDLRNFLTPLRLLAAYATFATFMFLLLRTESPLETRLGLELDASFSLLLFLPTLTVGWLFTTDTSGFRGDILAPWRARAGYALGVLWIDFALAFVDDGPSADLAPLPLLGTDAVAHLVTVVYLAAFVAALAIHLNVERFARRWQVAQSAATVAEAQPAKGRKSDHGPGGLSSPST